MPAERRLGFVHRVVAKHHGLKEYAVLITDRRSIFILLKKSRGRLNLQGETWFGSGVGSDVRPKRLEDYPNVNAVASNSDNLTIPHDRVTRLAVMKGRIYSVYRFKMEYTVSEKPQTLLFYLLPLGLYMRDKRLAGQRAPILRGYAAKALSLYEKALPPEIIESAQLAG